MPVLCTGQLLRPKGERLLFGGCDCSTCKADDLNKQCPFYRPVTIRTFKVLPVLELEEAEPLYIEDEQQADSLEPALVGS